MCGRLTLKTPPDQWTQLLLPVLDSQPLWSNWQPRYNIAPTQKIVVIAGFQGEPDAPRSVTAARSQSAEEPGPHFKLQRWGLVPAWSNDLNIGSRMINARHETLREKKSFKGPLRNRRCLIVADGYYEWQLLNTGGKQPHWISPSQGGLLQLAGLWEINTRATGQTLETCTIITTAANDRLRSIHDRMPVVLDSQQAKHWMDPACDAEEAYDLLGPAADEALRPLAVSPYVNNARHEGAACLAVV